MIISKRKLLIFLLICALATQSMLFYFALSNYNMFSLTSEAECGHKIWLKSNCQSCHQIYGFGGFIGPDLTNSIERLTKDQIKQILTLGSKQMPAFNFNINEQKSLIAYLKHLNTTGKSKPKVKQSQSFIEYLKGLNMPDVKNIHVGFNIIMRKKCFYCHLPSKDSIKAPNLINVTIRLTKKEFFKILKYGNPLKGMPIFNFTTKESQYIYEYLQWLNGCSPVFQDKSIFKISTLAEIPWFEYE